MKKNQNNTINKEYYRIYAKGYQAGLRKANGRNTRKAKSNQTTYFGTGFGKLIWS